MTEPKRIQLSRKKGWRKPEGAVVVARPTKFGNLFRAYKADCCGYWDVRDENGVTYIIDHDVVHRDLDQFRADRSTWTTKLQMTREAVHLYHDELTYWVGGRMDWDPEFAEAVWSLKGKDLACWCRLDQPCHADVLLAIANGGRQS